MSDTVKKFGKFNVRIVRTGEKYGLNRCLTNGENHNLTEFYDSTQDPQKFGELGQFVSRYYLSTLLERKNSRSVHQGLCLDGGVPAWNVDGPTFAQIQDWLEEQSHA